MSTFTLSSRRAEYQLLDKSIEASKLQVRMEIGKRLPTVAIGAGWNYYDFDKGSPFEMDKNFGMVFATVAVPITDWWGGSHAIKKQKIQVMIAENEKRNNEGGTGLLTDLLDAQSALQQARDQHTEAVTVFCMKILFISVPNVFGSLFNSYKLVKLLVEKIIKTLIFLILWKIRL